jgi:hypothetical protein
MIRVRVEIMGSSNCRIVGESQPVLIMINPIIFTRTRMKKRPGPAAAMPQIERWLAGRPSHPGGFPLT